jgi:DNA-binding CsgD family transcriptional regulator
MESLLSILSQQSEKLNGFEKLMSHKNKTMEELGEQSEDILYHSDDDFNLQYLNPTGCQWFQLDRDRVLGDEGDFFKRYFHPDTLSLEIPNIKWFYKHHSPDTVYSSYQKVFNPEEKTFVICLVFVKKHKVSCGYLSLNLPIVDFHKLNNKIKRIIEEELFRYNHLKEFSQLTEREAEILKLVALGKSNPEISKELFISRCTVEQHRKNINRKLHIKGLKDIMDFAYAYDLV